MGFRDRDMFSGKPDYEERRDFDPDKYRDKYILPTDGASYINGERLPESEKPAEPQSRIPDPHLKETRVDGSRSVDERYVFGDSDQNDRRAPDPAPRSGFSSYQQPADSAPRSGFSSVQQPTEPAGRYDRNYSQQPEPVLVRPISIQPISPSSTAERPMVFSLRDIRDMYVYEYSDRLEFYRKTDRGTMVFCSTEYKTRV